MNISGPADIQEREGKKDGINMAQGHDIQAHIMFVEVKIHRIVQVIGDMRLMRANDTLGLAGCAGCVD